MQDELTFSEAVMIILYCRSLVVNPHKKKVGQYSEVRVRKVCWERADFLALVCGVFCEFVTFPLVSWVRCGT